MKARGLFLFWATLSLLPSYSYSAPAPILESKAWTKSCERRIFTDRANWSEDTDPESTHSQKDDFAREFCFTKAEPNSSPSLPSVRVAVVKKYNPNRGVGAVHTRIEVTKLRGEFSGMRQVVRPSGYLQTSLRIDLDSVPKGEESFTFLVIPENEELNDSPWIGKWIHTTDRVSISGSVESQILSGPSEVRYIEGRDLRKTKDKPDLNFERKYGFRIISPSHCTDEAKMRSPLDILKTESSWRVLQAFVCMQLDYFGPGTQNLSHADRRNIYMPKLKALVSWLNNPSNTGRFEPDFDRIILGIASKKVSEFSTRAFNEYNGELLVQEGRIRNLATWLYDENNPMSLRRHLEFIKNWISDNSQKKREIENLSNYVQSLAAKESLAEVTQVLASATEVLAAPEVLTDDGIENILSDYEKKAAELNRLADEIKNEREFYEKHR